ncbi:hypothetical protein CCO03_14695 [Comamonas serinivorans]|uniref:Uncharacterized protein n=1 Tax=Comamonas serinivorans TaxID=1082851 RepID=A0A1Y0EQ31_9BURK|nr:circularly permuted type 2 ATP-grasp protein [Comamonas serinivorans]ARU05767.1 hypothetical protein CCO03_14695 [Comamonas serinivorans]
MPASLPSLLGDLVLGSAADLAPALLAPATPGHFDEVRRCLRAPGDDGPSRPVSPAWQTFFDELGLEGLESLPLRFAELDRQVRDDGATYNVHAEASRLLRPWSLDLFPLLIQADEWQAIEAGVLQRAKLLNHILADAYGPRELLRRGLLPAELVRGHPGFLHALQDTQVADGTWLRVLAFDLVRAPDGQWRLVTQRTQAPSGLGYLLENRLAIARQFPQAFQALQVRRLAATYTAFMAGLEARCPPDGAPHVALLTPGPYSETYFEHAFLARYLGVTLVQGSDLTVRQSRLYLKTLEGLRPVHALIKRLDDGFLDPLELQANSTLGVPGLLQAIRAGHVVMANMPGAGFLESPALLGFLPRLAEQVLGEPLHLPALPTWWCGEQPALDQALPLLDQSVIKPTVRGSRLHADFEPVFGDRLSAPQREAWAARIRQAPSAHTLQQWVPSSQMPSWTVDAHGTGQVTLKSMVLRVYALSTGPQTWRVLPGGMARLSAPHERSAAMRLGASSADVWVSAQAREAHTSRLPQTTVLATRSRPPVTSRAAENLFWLGRYTERAENSVRLARQLLALVDGEDLPSPAVSRWAMRMACRNGLVPDEGTPQATAPHLEQALRVFERTVIADLGKVRDGYSVAFNLSCMQQTAQSVRERLSLEQWQLIQQASTELDHASRAACALQDAGRHAAPAALRLLTDVSARLSAITGCQTDRMTRDSGWRLLFIGRLIERLAFLADTLALALDHQSLTDVAGFEAVVALFDSTITFHARHQQRRNLLTLCDVLVTDDENPRALAWVSQTVRSHLDKLQAQVKDAGQPLSALLPNPDGWQAEALCLANLPTPLLATLLDELGGGATSLSDALGTRFFTLSDASTSVMS